MRVVLNSLCSQFVERLLERANCPSPIVEKDILMVDAAQLSAGELDQVVTKAAEMKGPLLVQKYAFLFLERLAERN